MFKLTKRSPLFYLLGVAIFAVVSFNLVNARRAANFRDELLADLPLGTPRAGVRLWLNDRVERVSMCDHGGTIVSQFLDRQASILAGSWFRVEFGFGDDGLADIACTAVD